MQQLSIWSFREIYHKLRELFTESNELLSRLDISRKNYFDCDQESFELFDKSFIKINTNWWHYSHKDFPKFYSNMTNRSINLNIPTQNEIQFVSANLFREILPSKCTGEYLRLKHICKRF